MVTYKDVIKGLKCCNKVIIAECKECPYDEKGCESALLNDTIELLERQSLQLHRYRVAINANYGKEVRKELK